MKIISSIVTFCAFSAPLVCSAAEERPTNNSHLIGSGIDDHAISLPASADSRHLRGGKEVGGTEGTIRLDALAERTRILNRDTGTCTSQCNATHSCQGEFFRQCTIECVGRSGRYQGCKGIRAVDSSVTCVEYRACFGSTFRQSEVTCSRQTETCRNSKFHQSAVACEGTSSCDYAAFHYPCNCCLKGPSQDCQAPSCMSNGEPDADFCQSTFLGKTCKDWGNPICKDVDVDSPQPLHPAAGCTLNEDVVVCDSARGCGESILSDCSVLCTGQNCRKSEMTDSSVQCIDTSSCYESTFRRSEVTCSNQGSTCAGSTFHQSAVACEGTSSCDNAVLNYPCNCCLKGPSQDCQAPSCMSNGEPDADFCQSTFLGKTCKDWGNPICKDVDVDSPQPLHPAAGCTLNEDVVVCDSARGCGESILSDCSVLCTSQNTCKSSEMTDSSVACVGPYSCVSSTFHQSEVVCDRYFSCLSAKFHGSKVKCNHKDSCRAAFGICVCCDGQFCPEGLPSCSGPNLEDFCSSTPEGMNATCRELGNPACQTSGSSSISNVDPDSLCKGFPCGDGRRKVCHRTSYSTYQTRCIESQMIQAHLDHGGACGPCDFKHQCDGVVDDEFVRGGEMVLKKGDLHYQSLVALVTYVAAAFDISLTSNAIQAYRSFDGLECPADNILALLSSITSDAKTLIDTGTTGETDGGGGDSKCITIEGNRHGTCIDKTKCLAMGKEPIPYYGEYTWTADHCKAFDDDVQCCVDPTDSQPPSVIDPSDSLKNDGSSPPTCKDIPDRSEVPFVFDEKVYGLSLQSLFLSNLVYGEDPWPPGEHQNFKSAYKDYTFTIIQAFESSGFLDQSFAKRLVESSLFPGVALKNAMKPSDFEKELVGGMDQALVAESNGRCFGIFRGTLAPFDINHWKTVVGGETVLKDWLSNLIPRSTDICGDSCDCCSGRVAFASILFNDFFSSFKKELLSCASKCEDPTDCIVLGGHSQGGAVAELAAAYFAEYDPWLITFGRPSAMKNPCPHLSNLRQYNFCNTREDTVHVGLLNKLTLLRHDPVFFLPTGFSNLIGLSEAGNFGHTIFLSDHTSAAAGLDVSKHLENPLDLDIGSAFKAAKAHGPLNGKDPLFGEQSYFEHLNGLYANLSPTDQDNFSFIPSNGWEDGSRCFFDEECMSRECACTIQTALFLSDVYGSSCLCKGSHQGHGGGGGDW